MLSLNFQKIKIVTKNALSLNFQKIKIVIRNALSLNFQKIRIVTKNALSLNFRKIKIITKNALSLNFRKIRIVTRNALFEILAEFNECNCYRNESSVIHDVAELQNASKNNEFEICRKIEINAQERDDFKKKLKFINNRAVFLENKFIL